MNMSYYRHVFITRDQVKQFSLHHPFNKLVTLQISKDPKSGKREEVLIIT